MKLTEKERLEWRKKGLEALESAPELHQDAAKRLNKKWREDDKSITRDMIKPPQE